MNTITADAQSRIGQGADPVVVDFCAKTVAERIALRIGQDTCPDALHYTAVDAAVKMYRRIYFEGISSEGTDGINTSFVEDILREYDAELSAWAARNGGCPQRQRPQDGTVFLRG